tara:strand:- start:101 stop:1453 length:1353 start_codon:yes stop_codon:yes gene_type:complete
LISIISVPILLRLINPTFWGEVALLVGMQAFVVGLISQGKSASIERYFTKMNRKFAKFYSLRYLYISILIFFIVFIILEVGFRLAYFNFFDLPYGLPLRFALIGSLLLAHNRFLISILRSNQESLKVLKYNQLLSISTPVTQILLIYFIISISDFQDRMIVSAYFFAQVLILLINNISLLNFIRKNINFKTEVNNDNLGKISTYSNFTYLFMIFSSLINWADRYFLKIYSSQLNVGLYDAIYRIVDILGVIVGSFMIAIAPILFSRKENNNNYFKNIKYQIEITFLLSLAGIFISPIAIEIILPSIYFSQIKIVPILLLGLAFASSASALTTIFSVNERRDLNLKGIAIGAILNIVLNIVFIPTYGTLGAAYAMLLSSLFWFLANLYFSRSFSFKPKGLFINLIIVSLISFIHFYLWEFSFIYNILGIIFFLYISYRSFKIFKKLIVVSI